ARPGTRGRTRGPAARPRRGRSPARRRGTGWAERPRERSPAPRAGRPTITWPRSARVAAVWAAAEPVRGRRGGGAGVEPAHDQAADGAKETEGVMGGLELAVE